MTAHHSVPRSGGDYAYIKFAFGPLLAFLYLWAALLVIMPAGNAIIALTFANYILEPFYPECDPPEDAVRLIAASLICEGTLRSETGFHSFSFLRFSYSDQLLQCQVGSQGDGDLLHHKGPGAPPHHHRWDGPSLPRKHRESLTG